MRMFRILLANAWFKHIKPKENKKLSKTVIKFAEDQLLRMLSQINHSPHA